MNHSLRIGLLGIGLLMLAGCTTYYQPRYGDGGVYYDDGPYYSDGRYSGHTSVAVINPVHYPYWSLDYFYFSRHYHPYSVFVGYHEPFYYPYPGWAFSYRPYRNRIGVSIGFGDPWFGYPWHGYGLRFQPGYYGHFSYPLYSSGRYSSRHNRRYYDHDYHHPVRRVDARLRALEQRESRESRRALLARHGGSAYGSIGRPGDVRDGQSVRSIDSRSGQTTGRATDRSGLLQARGGDASRSSTRPATRVSPRDRAAGRVLRREAVPSRSAGRSAETIDRRGQVQRRVPDRAQQGRSNRIDPRLNRSRAPEAGNRSAPSRQAAPVRTAPRPSGRAPVSAPPSRASAPAPSARPVEPRRSAPRESAPRRASPPPRSRASRSGNRSGNRSSSRRSDGPRSRGRLRDRR